MTDVNFSDPGDGEPHFPNDVNEKKKKGGGCGGGGGGLGLGKEGEINRLHHLEHI